MRLYFDFANGGKRAQIFVGQIRKRKKRAAFGWFSANTLSQKKKTGFIIFAIFVMLLALPPAPPPPTSKIKNAAKVLLSLSEESILRPKAN